MQGCNVVSCRIAGNRVRAADGAIVGRGAGVYARKSIQTLVNCEFVANEATRGGGLYAENYLETSPADGFPPVFQVYNCTFFGNSAIDVSGTSGIGGGADALGVDADGGEDFVNCIFRGNVAESGNVALDNVNAVPSQVPATYCCIEDETADDSVFIFAGNGNIDSNPLFTDENATPPQLGLRITSPCIDAGNTFPVPTDQFNVDAAVFPGDAPDTNVTEFTPDLLLHRRVVDVASVANTGEGDDCGVVDMGALEHIPPWRHEWRRSA